MHHCRRSIAVLAIAALSLLVLSHLSAAEAPPVDFRTEVLPLLRERCFRCHEGRDAKSGHRLDVRAELLGTSGKPPLIVPGESAASRLIEVVSGRNPDTIMPPEGPRLPEGEVRLLQRWIDAGAPWDKTALPEHGDAAKHWAFQPIKRPKVPPFAAVWARNPIDAFIATEHRRMGVAAAPAAERRVLIRRLYFDLLGLPPSWETAEDFVADSRPDAVELLVEGLLASPHYGERWGRHWLDVARWAESEGFESNHPRPSAWRYRDYVVRAFTEDMPFDRFLRVNGARRVQRTVGRRCSAEKCSAHARFADS